MFGEINSQLDYIHFYYLRLLLFSNSSIILTKVSLFLSRLWCPQAHSNDIFS